MINAAAGYPQYSGNLITPMFETDLVEQFYCSSVTADITNTDYSGMITKCGDQVTFFRTPRVIIQDHVKDGTNDHQTIDSTPITMTIDKAKKFSVKVDTIDKKQICNWDKWEAATLKSASYQLGQEIDRTLLPQMWLEAPAANRGANAGLVSGSYNLGVAGAPLVLTGTNIVEWLTDIMGVLAEQCAPEDMFIVLPPIGYVTLLNSPRLTQTFCCDLTKDALNGRIPQAIMGFDVYISNQVPHVFDAVAGAEAYYIVAGWKGSTSFALQMQETRITSDANNWDYFLQGLSVYGYKVIQEEGMTASYVRFS